jgi:hypothetical protein
MGLEYNLKNRHWVTIGPKLLKTLVVRSPYNVGQDERQKHSGYALFMFRTMWVEQGKLHFDWIYGRTLV